MSMRPTHALFSEVPKTIIVSSYYCKEFARMTQDFPNFNFIDVQVTMTKNKRKALEHIRSNRLVSKIRF